jgi:hypothetical protein
MLAEHGELLGQVAVELGQLVKARRVEDLALAPLLEGVRAAAAEPDVELSRRRDQFVPIPGWASASAWFSQIRWLSRSCSR